MKTEVERPTLFAFDAEFPPETQVPIKPIKEDWSPTVGRYRVWIDAYLNAGGWARLMDIASRGRRFRVSVEEVP